MAETMQTNVDIVDPVVLELRNFFKKSLKASDEDLMRVITPEEQIELCSRLKCRVDIWRWNPVYEYQLEFKRKGRYQRWDNKLRLRMLAHSVNLKKPGVIYDENVIAKIRKTEWETQKKKCILSLNFWNRQREKAMNQSIFAFEDSSEQESMTSNASNNGNTSDLSAQEIHSMEDDAPINDNALDPASNPGPANDFDNSEGTDNINHLLNCLNTESMTIATQSEISEPHLQPSQDVLSSDYDNFNNEIPLTSTQSQHPESNYSV